MKLASALSCRALCTALTASVVIPTSIAAACSLAPAPEIVVGFFGFSFGVFVDEPLVLPQNAAVVGEGILRVDGAAVALEPLPGLPGVSRPITPLAEGARVSFDEMMATVGPELDLTAPEATVVTGGAFHVSESPGCGAYTCGTIVSLTVDLEPARDDLTPEERMSYVLYLGRSADEVSVATEPDGFYLRDHSGAVWRFANRSEGNQDIWVAVAAVDLAGNVGERSESMQIHTASAGNGCVVGRSMPSAANTLVLVGLALLWVGRRRS